MDTIYLTHPLSQRYNISEVYFTALQHVVIIQRVKKYLIVCYVHAVPIRQQTEGQCEECGQDQNQGAAD